MTVIVKSPDGFQSSDPELLKKLWIKNPEYISAVKRGNGIWGINKIPKEIPLYLADKKKGVNYIPSGVASYYGFDGSFDNEVMSFPDINGDLRDDQKDIVDKLLSHRYAYGHISTGVGKTWILLEIARRLQRKTLIVVDGASALEQFNQNIQDIFGINPFVVGKKKYSDSPISITTIHSIHKCNPNSYGLILYDEADKYLGSQKRRDALCGICSEYAYAVTGTTKLNDIDDKVFPIYYGKKESLIKKNLKPLYTQIKTSFQMYSFDDFHEIEEALYSNEKRNDLIVSTVAERLSNKKASKVVVFSKRVEHSKGLQAKFDTFGYKTFLLIGEVKQEERERIRKEIIDHPDQCILIGNVQIIGRGFDCPPLDLGVLTTAEKFESNLNQYVGRIIRNSPGKTSCEFIDMVDVLNPILLNQSKKRLSNFRKEFP